MDFQERCWFNSGSETSGFWILIMFAAWQSGSCRVKPQNNNNAQRCRALGEHVPLDLALSETAFIRNSNSWTVISRSFFSRQFSPFMSKDLEF
ncbi:hypothetical protein GCM10027217_31500 [Pseudomaricurvus hydrocarbonicus]